MEETIQFLERECTAEKFYWMIEILDDIVERTKSRAFIDCLYKSAERHHQAVIHDIKHAEKFFE
jgi:hypothetical protein